MSQVAWFHCFSGIAGDMALGSLIDAGAELDEITALCGRLPLTGWDIEVADVLRGGIGGCQVTVIADPTTVVRTAAHIAGMIEEARFPNRIRDRVLAIFDLLARVEGRLHRRPPSQVHFHEVGAVDSIVDIVGTCAALEVLDVDVVTASSVATGTGIIRSAHGFIPNPSPAVVALLAGAPTHGIDTDVELTTPTGAAILAALATGWGPMPAMRVGSSGFGAGTADPDHRPNLTQVVLGQQEQEPARGQPVTLLEVNVDDVTGEVLAHAINVLIREGAHDAWLSPIVGKKGRPGYVVSLLCDPSTGRRMGELLTRETGSLGVRGQTFERFPAARAFDQVDIDGHAVRLKITGGRAKVEYDDAARVAGKLGLPVREVLARAEHEHRSASKDPSGDEDQKDWAKVVELGPFFGLNPDDHPDDAS